MSETQTETVAGPVAVVEERPAAPAPVVDPSPAQADEAAPADDKLSLTEAMDVLTVAEVLTIERHYDRDLSKLSGTALTVAVAWAHERRRLQGQKDKPDWADVNAWTMKRLNDYFAPEAVEVDEQDPETAQGKDDSLAG